MYSVIILITAVIINTVYCQLTSPCPRLFTYEPQSNETDRWYGQATLISDEDLSGIWFRLVFDKPAIQLGLSHNYISMSQRRAMYSVIILITAVITNTIYCQLISPCPRLFTYEPQSNENDRWYGQATLISDADLSGVWFRLVFDRTSIQLGNWFGEVVTTDHKEYLIKNRTHKLPANTPLKIRIFLKYNPNEPPPKLIEYRLNAKTICPEGGTPTEAPVITSGEPLTSSELSTTSMPINTNRGSEMRNKTFVRPGGGFSLNAQGTDDDYFRDPFEPVVKLDAVCGLVIKQPTPLITHGQATREGEFPWHAALYHTKGIDLNYICGGSLISKYHIITAAHCVTKRNIQSIVPADSLVVYLGKFYLKMWGSAGIQERNVEKITVHPEFSFDTYSSDLAILRLQSAVKITDYVRPICLWEESNGLESIVGKQGTVVGWGFDEKGKLTEELTKAHMPVVSQETCIYSFPDFYSRFTSTRTYCAGFNNGTSVCNGDSGGGMIFPKTGSNANSPTWQIRGLVSLSVALQDKFNCDPMHYVIFTDLAKYLNWIKRTLAM